MMSHNKPDVNIRIYILSRLEFAKLSKVQVEVKHPTTNETMVVPMKLAHPEYQYVLVADFMMPFPQKKKSRSSTEKKTKTWFSYTFTIFERAVRFQDTTKYQFRYSQRIAFHKDPITPLTFRFGSMDIPFMFAISYGVHEMFFIEHLLDQLVNSKCTLELAVDCINIAKKTQFFNSRNLTDTDQEKLLENFTHEDKLDETLRALFLFYSVSFSEVKPQCYANLSEAIVKQNVNLKTLLSARHLRDFEVRISNKMSKKAESDDWILLLPVWNAVDIAIRSHPEEPPEIPQYPELEFDDTFLLECRESLGIAVMADLQHGESRRLPLETLIFQNLPSNENGFQTAMHLTILFDGNPYKEHFLRNISESSEALPRLMYGPGGGMLKTQLQTQYRMSVPASAGQFQNDVRHRKLPNIVRKSDQSASGATGTGTASGVEHWDVEEVCKWLVDLAPVLHKYVDDFRENGIDGEMLLAMTEEDLEDMVKRPIQRRKILVGIEKLKSPPPAPVEVVEVKHQTVNSLAQQEEKSSLNSNKDGSSQMKKSSSNSSLDKLDKSQSSSGASRNRRSVGGRHSRGGRRRGGNMRRVNSHENVRKNRQAQNIADRAAREDTGEAEKVEETDPSPKQQKRKRPARRPPRRRITRRPGGSTKVSPKNSTDKESESPKNSEIKKDPEPEVEPKKETQVENNDKESPSPSDKEIKKDETPPLEKEESSPSAKTNDNDTNEPKRGFKLPFFQSKPPQKITKPPPPTGKPPPPNKKTSPSNSSQDGEENLDIPPVGRQKLSIEDCCHSCGWGKLAENTCCPKCSAPNKDIQLPGKWNVNRDGVSVEVLRTREDKLKIIFKEGKRIKNTSELVITGGHHYLNGWQLSAQDSNLEVSIWKQGDKPPVVWKRAAGKKKSQGEISDSPNITYKWVNIKEKEQTLGIRLKVVKGQNSVMRWRVTSVTGDDAKAAGVNEGDLIVSVNNGHPPRSKEELVQMLKTRPLLVQFEPPQVYQPNLPAIDESPGTSSPEDSDLPKLETREEVQAKASSLSASTSTSISSSKNNGIPQLEGVPPPEEEKTCPWTEQTDPASGDIYYYNHDSADSVWEKPQELIQFEKWKKEKQKQKLQPSQQPPRENAEEKDKLAAIQEAVKSGGIEALKKSGLLDNRLNSEASKKDLQSNGNSVSSLASKFETSSTKCEYCGKQATVNCAVCDVDFCAPCNSKVHSNSAFKSHKTTPLEKADVSNFKFPSQKRNPRGRMHKKLQSEDHLNSSLSSTMDKLSSQTQLLRQHSQEFDTREQQILGKFSGKMDEIKLGFAQAMEMLKKQEERILHELKDEEERVCGVLKEQKQPFMKYKMNIIEQQQAIETVMHPQNASSTSTSSNNNSGSTSTSSPGIDGSPSLGAQRTIKNSEILLANVGECTDSPLPEIFLDLKFDANFEQACQDFCILESSMKNNSGASRRKVRFQTGGKSPIISKRVAIGPPITISEPQPGAAPGSSSSNGSAQYNGHHSDNGSDHVSSGSGSSSDLSVSLNDFLLNDPSARQ